MGAGRCFLDPVLSLCPLCRQHTAGRRRAPGSAIALLSWSRGRLSVWACVLTLNTHAVLQGQSFPSDLAESLLGLVAVLGPGHPARASCSVEGGPLLPGCAGHSSCGIPVPARLQHAGSVVGLTRSVRPSACGSPQTRGRACVPCVDRWSLTSGPAGKSRHQSLCNLFLIEGD